LKVVLKPETPEDNEIEKPKLLAVKISVVADVV
jgi:hypothetical protein